MARFIFKDWGSDFIPLISTILKTDDIDRAILLAENTGSALTFKDNYTKVKIRNSRKHLIDYLNKAKEQNNG